MQLTNTDTRYGFVAIFLHWLMTIIIIGLLALGLYMVQLPISHEKLKLYGWHKEFGLLVLMLVVIRLTWRLINMTPRLVLPLWEKIAARGAHWTLYLLMFAMPLTGWLITSAAGLPPSFFGLFVLPTLIQPNDQLLHVFQAMHQWIGYSFIAVIALHMSAALKHHFINRDDILRRMLSWW
jgi:cytochrome b561